MSTKDVRKERPGGKPDSAVPVLKSRASSRKASEFAAAALFKGAKGRTSPSLYAQMFRATPYERIDIIRKGVPATEVVATGDAMGLAKERMFNLLHFTRATVNRRIKEQNTLPSEYSERIIGLQKLIGQVEVMVAESGDPTGFNAAHWVAEWLEKPIPALNYAKPAEFMDTIEGQELVSSLLAKMQSGAYA